MNRIREGETQVAAVSISLALISLLLAIGSSILLQKVSEQCVVRKK